MGLGQSGLHEEGSSSKFKEPEQVDPKLREHLGIFEEEELVRSPAVISIDNSDSYSKYQLPVTTAFENLSQEKNYEIFPVGVLHNLFLFLRPNDLVSLFSTCRYFHKAGLSNVFWKKYYIFFFDMDVEQFDNMDKLNYKKQFFKRFSDCRCANLYYLNNQKPIFLSKADETKNGVKGETTRKPGVVLGEISDYENSSSDVYLRRKPLMTVYGYMICGPPNIGKRSLLLRLWKDTFDSDEKNHHPQNELVGKSEIFFNVIARKHRHRKREVEDKHKIVGKHYEDAFRIVRILSGLNKDPAELQRYEDMTNSFLFCFIAGDRKTFEEAKNYVKQFSKIMKKYVPKKQRRRGILVGLKSDLLGDKKREVGMNEIKRYVKETFLKGYVECSAKEDTSCYLPFGVLVHKIAWRVIQTGG